MKVLLVYPNLQMVNLLPSNIAILAGVLKENGIECRVFDTTLYPTDEKSVDDIRVEHLQLRPFNLSQKGVKYKSTDVFTDFLEVVQQFQPQIIGVTATDDTYDLGVQLIAKLSKIRQDLPIHVVFGGVFPTFSPERVIENPLVNSICLGEGEDALLELCRKLEAGEPPLHILNLWTKWEGQIYKNPLRPPIDLNLLPMEDFSVLEEQRLFRPMQGKIFRMIPVSPDRGCPYACTFCAAPVLRGMYRGCGKVPFFRSKKVSRIIAELQFQINATRADYIYFNSETFFARREEEIAEFARSYQREIGLPFWCQTRVETITEKRVHLLKDMNCDRISIGLEHGNEDFRKRLLQKPFTNAQVVRAFEILRSAGIPVTVNNIIGFPDETRDLVFDTVNLNRKVHADSINAYFFVPYSGTQLRSYCLEKGYVQPDDRTDSLMKRSILNMPQFRPEEIQGLVRTFPLYVKMPETLFEKIRSAEQLTPEGDKAFAELREDFWKIYCK